MSEQVQQNLKVTDQGAEKIVQKTPEAAKEGGVISAQPNQEVHGQAFAQAHANDRNLTDPDMIAMEEGETIAQHKARVAQIQANRFGFFDSERESAGDAAGGKTKVHELKAKQAVEPIAPVSESIKTAPDASPVVLNVQITNVPEVSEGVKPEEALEHLNQVFEAGAQAVRPIKEWMATPNAVSDALVSIGPALDNAVNYYANTPADQVQRDTGKLIEQAADALDRTFSYPHTTQERARVAGNLMPMFFFEGNTKEPIKPQTVEQMGLESMSETELTALSIRREVKGVSEFQMPEIPENLQHLEVQMATPELLESMQQKGRIIILAQEGSDDLARLKASGASGIFIVTDEGEMLITLPQQPTKIAALEEFLHGTQAKLGSIERLTAEIEVKDFMLRHAKMLGLTENDCIVLQQMKENEILRLESKGYTWLGN